MEIIANSSYALRNMGIYSQVANMICISSIWDTTQSENIISPPNKDNMPITNMQIALKTLSEVQSITDYEGNEMDLGDGDRGDDGAGGDVDGEAYPIPRRRGDDDGIDFPLTGGSGAVGSALSQSRRRLFASVTASINHERNMA